MNNLTRDIRLAARRHLRARGFSFTIVATLALGIGVATAVLTVANAVLLRRLPVADQNRIVVLDVPVGMSDAQGFARSTSLLRSAALINYEGAAPVTIRDGERLASLRRSLVSGNFFDVLGAQPVLGRTFRDADDAPGAAPVVVISSAAWQSKFGGAADVIGKKITSHEDGLTSTIVGVMPPGLDYPRGVDAWIPVRVVVPPASLDYLGFDIIGRLAAETNIDGVRDAFLTFLHRPGSSEADRKRQVRAFAFTDGILGNTRYATIAFALASSLLLLIACVNVANLFLVRGLSRVREIAVRRALGASTRRILGEIFVEHSLLTVVGGAVGAVVAILGVRAFIIFAPVELPRIAEVRVDGSLLLATCACMIVAAIFSVIVPSIFIARSEERLGASVPGAVRPQARTSMLRESLVGVQVALALLILSAAGLLGKSLWNLERVNVEFDASRMLIAELSLRAGSYGERDAQVALYDRLQPALESIAGIESASPVVAVPYAELTGWRGRPSADGQSEIDAAQNPFLDLEVVAPSFFRTVGLQMLQGRAFTNDDRSGSLNVVVVSESVARHYWSGTNAIGKRLRLGASSPWLTVVGVVPDTRYRNLRETSATMYFPLRQSPFPFAPPTLVIRSGRGANDIAAALRGVFREVAPDVELARVQSYESLLARPLAQPKMNALLLGVFASSAVVLSAIGLLGVFATTVRQRRREFGIRMALGATSANVARLAVTRGIVVIGAGVGAGLGAAIAGNSLLGALLFEVSPLDVGTLGFAVVTLVVTGLLSAFLPARASARIAPAIALRSE